ncbi:MAG: TonB-dependent receptor, partial [Candidatus Eremiobacteraeota bacterium]|nr:TonB-dependent receptor [Candidatus Eremiobacteraeota bacterium]
ELQVYTGATPANSEAQGLAGFINQVIRSGTYPGYGTAEIEMGGPTFYHSLTLEAGGATPNRNFSYYLGVGGWNQDHRYVDNFGGAYLAPQFGPILDGCQSPLPNPAPASCLQNGQPVVGLPASVGGAYPNGYILGPIGFGGESPNIFDRTIVANVHIAIPHKHGDVKDDVQLLYDNDEVFSPLMISLNDEGLVNLQGTTYFGTAPYYTDTFQYNGPLGATLPSGTANIVPYFFPSSPTQRIFNGVTFPGGTYTGPVCPPSCAYIPPNDRDVNFNAQSIVKVQYQKNFSTEAFLRVYGYTYYSNWLATGPSSSWQPYTGLDSGDYELISHTRGVSASYTQQFGTQHLVEGQASYTASNVIQIFNTQMFNFPGLYYNATNADQFAVLVNPNDLTSGKCYALPTAGTAATETTCNANLSSATFASQMGTFMNGGVLSDGTATPFPSLAGLTCGTGPCSFYTVENGAFGDYDNNMPILYGYSLTDQYRPNDKLLFNLGLRLDTYYYPIDNTQTGPARTFWFNAFNNDSCYNTQFLTIVDKTQIGLLPENACSLAGSQYQAATLYNPANLSYTYNILQPRVGMTYTMNPDTVLRASYGKYNEQPSSAYESYDSMQQNLPAVLSQYYALGFNSPGHQVRPPISYNTDFSYERHFKGTDMSIKITPFLRQTQDAIENFYINTKSAIISGLNAGAQTSDGFELAFTKGDFERNGFAADLAFAYTNTYVKYSTLSNGNTLLSGINADIMTYNAYTQACATGTAIASLCGATTNGQTAAACYTTGGAPDATCAAGDIANPYWNDQPRGTLNPNGHYLPYSTLPGAIGTGVNAYNYPYVATLILNYKHDKFAFTPSFQFVAGNRYGAPEVWPGIDPAAGCSPLTAPPASDPRYSYGFPTGTNTSYSYDAHTCLGLLPAIPDVYTGVFDQIGAFREPAQLVINARATYDLTPKVSLALTLTNLLDNCFGGQVTSFTYFWGSHVCSYTGIIGAASPVGNAYNPGDNVQRFLQYPYQPDFATYNDLSSSTTQPFNAYLSLNIKI